MLGQNEYRAHEPTVAKRPDKLILHEKRPVSCSAFFSVRQRPRGEAGPLPPLSSGPRDVLLSGRRVDGVCEWTEPPADHAEPRAPPFAHLHPGARAPRDFAPPPRPPPLL